MELLKELVPGCSKVCSSFYFITFLSLPHVYAPNLHPISYQ
jgi:hypothetical protein